MVFCQVKLATVLSSVLSRSGTFHIAVVKRSENKFPKLASYVIYLQLYYEKIKTEFSAIVLLSHTVLSTTQTTIAGREKTPGIITIIRVSKYEG